MVNFKLFGDNLVLIMVVSVVLILITTQVGFSQVRTVWSCSGENFVSTHRAIQNDLYVSSHGSIRFKEGKTGIIYASCPFTQNYHDQSGPGDTVWCLGLTYRARVASEGDDVSGTPPTPGSTVKASFKRVKKSNGDIDIIYSINSFYGPNSTPTGWATHKSCNPYQNPGRRQGHTFDFDNYYYYVAISLERNNPDVPTGALGVYLTK